MSAWILGLVLACGVQSPDAKEPAQVGDPSGAYVSAKTGALTGPFNNRLETADSPYLKMHGHDPVNWYPWGDEAFAEAKRRNVPVFLSIGYYACHWCHVMHRESFKDPALAAFLNEKFVAIKVDREERPDIDSLYMDAVHLLNRNNGGWPASIWLTPDRKPFFAGTYFPPKDRHGRPGFRSLLERIDTDWTTKPADIETFAERTRGRIIKRAQGGGEGVIPADIGDMAADRLAVSWSPETRGFGTRRQFPMTASLQFLLWHSAVHDNDAARRQAVSQLTAMDEGGIHDHLGGGFHRYTVDPNWQVPHFEKMLYDNGQLLSVYAEASVLADSPRFAQISRDIADYLIAQMQHPKGAFYSSQSADSEGEEGTFYVWTPEEIRALGPVAEPLIKAYGLTQKGNFERGRTVFNRDPAVDPEQADIKAARAALFDHREKREHPPTDDKLVVAWNGLTIGGMARAGRYLNEPRYIAAAQQAANHVLSHQTADGRLPRILAVGAPAGVLEDYAFLGNGLIDLYESDHDPRWLKAASLCANTMLARFQDPENGVLYQSDKSVQLITRKTDLTDGAEPSGPGRALRLLGRLRSLGDPNISAKHIDQPLKQAAWILERAPNNAPSLAHLADRVSRRSTEVIIASDYVDNERLKPFIDTYNETVRPHTVLSVVSTSQAKELELFTAILGKTGGVKGFQVFVCHDGACHQPTDDLAEFKRILKGS